MAIPPNDDRHARPGIFVTGERVRRILASIDQKITEAISLDEGKNTKTLGGCYLAVGTRHTMPTVMTEFAKVGQQGKETGQEGFQLIVHEISPQL
ncbi:MAG: hypothetical protein CME86_09135 [Herbaspirillum sp.]|nr:hypothetical protein [Herbaspirillum sp.]